MIDLNHTARSRATPRHPSSVRWTTRAAIFMLLASTAVLGHAQFGGMGGGRRGGRTSESAQGSQPAGRPTSRWEEASNRLYDIRLQLLISTAQGQAWQDFRARFIDAAMGASALAPADADEQSAATAVQHQLDTAQKRASELVALNTAVQALLAALSEDQRRTADRTLPPLVDEFIARNGNAPTSRTIGR